MRRAEPGGAVDNRLVGSILVEGVKEADTTFDRASVRVTDETRIFVRRGEERRRASFDDLRVGESVEARFTGPVMESYPVQANASEVVILK